MVGFALFGWSEEVAKNPKLIDLAGQRFGKWTVGKQVGNTSGGGALWSCKCDCGTERAVIGTDLRTGKSASCGCTIDPKRLGNMQRKHGGTGSRLYHTWKNMRSRCSNPNKPGYKNYGGRGISVCAEWDDFPTFQRWAETSGYRSDLSIERMDVNGNYEPNNCMWAGAEVQSANRRFVQRAPDGELWWHKARRNGITRAAYSWRIGKGWSRKLAVTWPLGKRREKRQRNAKGQFA